MDYKLEVVVIPVADVDRAKNFYQALGWREDADFAREDFRVVQLTPPGSAMLGHLRHGHHHGRTRIGPGPATGRRATSRRPGPSWPARSRR